MVDWTRMAEFRELPPYVRDMDRRRCRWGGRDNQHMMGQIKFSKCSHRIWVTMVFFGAAYI